MDQKKEKTVVAIVIDKSGSMSGTIAQTVSGYNEYVQQIKTNAAGIATEVCLVTFNGDVYEHLWLEPVEKLTEATVQDYRPAGSTAMLDAMSYTFNKLNKTGYDDETTSYLVLVISDGEENSSKHATSAEIRETVEALEKKENWTITYMGCNKDYLRQVAVQTGINVSNMAAWSNKSAEYASHGLRKSSEQVGKYMRSRSSGVKAYCCNFYNEDSASEVADYEQVDNSVAPTVVTAASLPSGCYVQNVPDQTATPVDIQSLQDQLYNSGMLNAGSSYAPPIASTYVPSIFSNASSGSGVFKADSPVTWQV